MLSAVEADMSRLPAGHRDFNFGRRYRCVERVEITYGRHDAESVAHPDKIRRRGGVLVFSPLPRSCPL